MTRLEVPGALALCASGCLVVLMAGGFDDLWHSFGLDETGWSFPHAMIGAGLQLTFMGILSCRLALRKQEPLRLLTLLGFAILLFMFSQDRLLGPLAAATPDTIRGISSIPVLQLQAAFQHVTRIELTWNLTRTNPLFVPVAALAGGSAMGMVWGMVRRPWLLLGRSSCPLAADTAE